METAFAKEFVSNPHSGELVKGHRIVLAEMGLVEYQGKIIRNPAIFDGDWAKSRRIEHILVRLAFVREIFARTGNERPTLYRGLAMEHGLEPPRNTTFVSATFNLDVAMSIFSGARESRDGALFRQQVSANRESIATPRYDCYAITSWTAPLPRCRFAITRVAATPYTNVDIRPERA